MSPPGARGDVLACRFRLDREVFRAEGATIFEAFDDVEQRRVEVEIATEPGGSQRAAAELAARLTGPHVLRVIATGETPDGHDFIVRETFLATAAEVLEERIELPTEEAVAWTLEICEAIAEAHAHDLAHGEVDLDAVVLAPGDGGDGAPVLKLRWNNGAKAGLSRDEVRRDLAGLGALLRALATGSVEPEAAPTLRSELAHAIARAEAKGDGGFANVAELARTLAPHAPPGHPSARVVTYLLTSAGVVGSAIPSPPGAPRATLDDWPRASLASSSATRRRRLAFALALLTLVGALFGGVIALWRSGRLLRTAASEPEPRLLVQTTLSEADTGTATRADNVTRRAVEDASRRRGPPRVPRPPLGPASDDGAQLRP